MASSSSLASHRLKYDVFLNFRGEDTRRNFTSHLYAALRQKDLQTFFDDQELKRGEEIAGSLPQAIQDSTVAVLVFSKDYASSSWCLDELAEIIECHRTYGQIVIPIFYEVNPSHLRKQSHDVAAAFVKHEQNPKNAHEIPRWRDALTTAANLSGFNSKEFRSDHMLINKIVEEILEKLNQLLIRDDFEHLVGMDSRIEEIKRIFTINPSEIRILGIWGMGGVGKTTTAEVIYKMMSHQFQSCCFVYNVRQQADAGGIKKLQEELISKALGEENPVKNMFGIGPTPFCKRILGRKKMLIVLDDVNEPLQLESLIGNPCWFGLGSMILITSRDKQVFGERADFIYEIKPLNHVEALELFTKGAFKQKYPKDDYVSLLNSIVKYAQGNPLALKVLGSSLIGKDHNEWRSALNQLSKVPNKDIQQVLQISYNGLNRVEKDVFLDIACFFKSESTNVVKKVLKSCGFDVDIIISVLQDKCLVDASKSDMLEMHDLLQEMGKEIVRQEARYPNQRSRLWDPEDIHEVFVGNKEAEAVESIILDSSKIRETNLNPQVFMKMPNLKFLNFYGESNLHLSQGLDYLPNTLRYLRWDKYPLKSFPPNFQPKNLVVLHLSNNNWNRIKEDSVMSQRTYGMMSVIANGFWRLAKLTSLSLVNNKRITHFPSSRSGCLEALEILKMNDCSHLNTFPEISSNIRQLFLQRTAIKQVPSSSVELLSKLEYLGMEDCKELESLPSNFFSKLTSLNSLYLSGSSRFKALPEILEPMDNLKILGLSQTAIEKLPSSIGNLKGIKLLGMDNCWKFAFYPESSGNCFLEDHQRLGSSLEGRSFTQNLYLSNNNLSELPGDLSFLSSIKSLHLSQNNFERIPDTIKQLSLLKYLFIDNCKRLLSLPELPSSISQLSAQVCGSLKQVWTLEQLPLDSQIEQTLSERRFRFWNCLKLDEDDCQAVVNALLRNYKRTQMQKSLDYFEMIYPGSRIPKWVQYQNLGDSIRIHLPPHWLNHLFMGFAFYLCHDNAEYDDGGICNLRYDCYFDDSHHFSSLFTIYAPPHRADKEHMLVFISEELRTWIYRHVNFEADVVVFKFSLSNYIIKKCGIIPLNAQEDQDEFYHTFNFPSPVSTMKIEEVE